MISGTVKIPVALSYPVALVPTNTNPSGMISVTSTPVALEIPLFVTLIVKFTSFPVLIGPVTLTVFSIASFTIGRTSTVTEAS